jgi:hypothetical protein
MMKPKPKSATDQLREALASDPRTYRAIGDQIAVSHSRLWRFAQGTHGLTEAQTFALAKALDFSLKITLEKI